MRVRLWLTARREWILAVAPSFAEFSVAALTPQFGMLVAGILTTNRNRIALLLAKRRQPFAAFSTHGPLFASADNLLVLAHVNSPPFTPRFYNVVSNLP